MGTGCDELIRRSYACCARLASRCRHPASRKCGAGAGAGAQLHHLMPALAIAQDLEFGRLVKLDVNGFAADHWDVMMAWRGDKRPIPPGGCWNGPYPVGAGRAKRT